MHKTVSALATALALQGCSPFFSYQNLSSREEGSGGLTIECANDEFLEGGYSVNRKQLSYSGIDTLPKSKLLATAPIVDVGVGGRFSNIGARLEGGVIIQSRSISREINGKGGFSDALCSITLPNSAPGETDTVFIHIAEMGKLRKSIAVPVTYFRP